MLKAFVVLTLLHIVKIESINSFASKPVNKAQTIPALFKPIGANIKVILLAKTIDGVYSADPKIDKTAIKYDEISYIDILDKDLKVMDSTATALCRDNKIPLIVFGIADPQNMVKIIQGEKIGTLVD